MYELDLLHFTNTSHKIPGSFLGIPNKKEVSKFKIFGAHFVDFYTVFAIFNIINVFINFNLDRLIITNSMEFSSAYLLKFSVGLPVVLLSYYFFSYFFNHGQTFGMKTFKLRMVIPEQSLKDSFFISIKSIGHILSFGLANRWIQRNEIKQEDYLYSEFMVHRDLAPINLIEEVQKTEISKEDYYQIAA